MPDTYQVPRLAATLHVHLTDAPVDIGESEGLRWVTIGTHPTRIVLFVDDASATALAESLLRVTAPVAA